MEPQTLFIRINDKVCMSASIAKLAEAMALSQGEMGSAPENAKNPHFGSSYADLESVINTAKPILAKHGLAVIQLPSGMPPLAGVTTIITHKSGEWIAGELTLKPSKDDPQGAGSAISYARRYSEESALNMATKDDDGNAASAPKPQTSPPARAPAEQPKPVAAKDAYPIDHMITFGKYKGMNVNQIARADFTKYLDWILDQARKAGKPLSRDAQEIMDKIDDLSGARQPQDGPPPDMFADVPF